jgi:pullulanase
MGLAAVGAYVLTRSGEKRPGLHAQAPGNGGAHPNGAVPTDNGSTTASRWTQRQEEADPSGLIQVSWHVRVPEGTPSDDTVYICGNHAALGHWNPMGVALHAVGNRLYRGDLRLPPGTSFEYKFTRGSWGRVEVQQSGADQPNRRLHLVDSAFIESNVEAWADQV